MKRVVQCSVVMVFVTVLAAATAASARAASPPPTPTRTVLVDRWVRSICDAWVDHMELELASTLEMDELLEGIDAGTARMKSLRRETLTVTRERMESLNDTLTAVEAIGAPKMTGGADLAASYRETVGDYVRVEVIAFDSLVKDRSDSIESFARALRGIEQDRLERMDLIGYDPIAELRADATLSDAIGSAAPCGMLAGWLDLGFASGIAVGECMGLEHGATFEDFTFGDLAITDCAAPHFAEVYFVEDHPARVARRIRVTKR